MAVASIHSSKEKSRGTPVNFRPLRAQQVHRLPVLQNVDTEGGKVAPAKRVLDSVHRHARWILPLASSPKQESLSRIYLQRAGFRVQRGPIRSECGPQSIHKGRSTCNLRASQGWCLGNCVFGRPVDNLSLRRSLQTSFTESTANNQENGIFDQRNKISIGASPEVRMAGSRMGLDITQSPSNSRKNNQPEKKAYLRYTRHILHSKGHSMHSRISKLDRTVRPDSETTLINNKENPKDVQKQAKRLHLLHSTKSQNALERLDLRGFIPSSPRLSSSRHYSTNGCIPKRLGIPSKPTKVLRQLRPHNELLYKRTRITNSLVFSTSNLKKKRCGASSMRQLNHNTSSKERRIIEPSTSNSSRINLAKSCPTELDPTSSTYWRRFQRPRRPTFQERGPVNRMVPKSQRFQESSQVEPQSSGGLIRHQPKQQTEYICQPMSGPAGNSGGCPDDQLGEMESLVSLSPVPADFPGFGETEQNLLHECSPTHSRNSNETMVHGSQTAEDPISGDRGTPATSCGRQSSTSTTNYQTSRMAVIRTAYEKKFPSCHETINLLTKPLRNSSLKDYEGKYLRFCSFLKDRQISPDNITLASVLEFFTYLFHEKNLRPGTIAHYRSALSVPLQLQFKIDLHDSAVSTLLRAMYIQKPNPPVKAPLWNLNKVLSLLNSWEENLPIEDLLKKTAFLLMFATGWRVSELHACVRDTEFCSISEEDTLLIRPHPSFLAKNESTKNRWNHKSIKPLRLADGTPGNLCPVNSLKQYLQSTGNVDATKLLLHPKTQKPLSIQQLSSYICKLILRADPSGRAKVHDIRKYAASCSLADSMDVSDMVTALHWSSERTFWKFYFAPTKPLPVRAVLPGNSRMECNSMAFTTLADSHTELSTE